MISVLSWRSIDRRARLPAERALLRHFHLRRGRGGQGALLQLEVGGRPHRARRPGPAAGLLQLSCSTRPNCPISTSRSPSSWSSWC
ncbi:MAG: hypothetical protein MZV70_65605 [Desulfobacterales bacterium]|nr:hypothetical protein [Desulfobacterales bacterium]